MNELNEIEQGILDRAVKEHNFIPNPLKLMQKRPGTIEKFNSYSEYVFGKGSLSKREKSLISLAATTALKAEHCISSKIDSAKKAGVNEDEIIQTILIAGLIAGNTTLHTAYEAFIDGDK